MRAEVRDWARSTTTAFVLGPLACAAWAAQSSLAEPASVRFTVRDAIELEQIVRQSDDLQSMLQANPVAATSLPSPDGSKFIFQTRKGLVDENVLQDTLWIVDAREIREFLDTPANNSDVTPSMVVTRRAASEWGVISHLQWLNAGEVGFIAADDSGVRQAFAVDIGRRRSRQMTSSPTDITAFAVAGNTVLYYATVPEASRQAYSIVSTDLADIIDPGARARGFPRVDLFVQSAHEPGKAIVAAPMRLLPRFQRIWISPDERFAIAMQPAIAWPAYWEEYQVPNMMTSQYSRSRATADGTSIALVNRVQYRLIDIRQGTSRPLLDAPLGLLALNFTPARAFWMNDSKSAIVSGTFLPLSGSTGAGRQQLARHPAIAEIQIATGKITPIVWEPAARSDSRGGREAVANPIVVVDFRRNHLIVSSASQRGSVLASTDPRIVTEQRYAKVSGHWQQVDMSAAPDAQNDLSIDLRQSLNKRAKIYAIGSRCRCSKLLWDMNPLADRFSFGPARLIEWEDRNEIRWQGGLIVPPDYDPLQRYPLVIQTHGFHSDEFLIDGPQGATTAFAAQPLANSGFVVLQVEDNAQASTANAREATYFAEGMRAAIVKLDSEGVIDASRVAAIGWSITGSYVMRLLSDHPDLLAAAVISDAAQFGYMPYLLSVNWPSSMRTMFDLYADSEGIANPLEVIAHDPQHKLVPLTPPIRLEAIGAGSVIGMWETYALLRFANRPVDFVYFPEGSHSLQKPAERLASQQGTVDWLRFWLQQHEDLDAAKRGQYELWRSMRKHALVGSDSSRDPGRPTSPL